MTETVTELKPCPFCGSDAEMQPWHGGSETKQLISCAGEECNVSPMTTGETPEEAIKAWNTRTPDALNEFANDPDVVMTIHARSYEKGVEDGRSQLLKDKEELVTRVKALERECEIMNRAGLRRAGLSVPPVPRLNPDKGDQS